MKGSNLRYFVIWPKMAKVPVVRWWRSELSYMKLAVVFFLHIDSSDMQTCSFSPCQVSHCCQVDLFGLIHFMHPGTLVCISLILKQSIVVKVCNRANGFIFSGSKCNSFFAEALQFTNEAVCTNNVHNMKTSLHYLIAAFGALYILSADIYWAALNSLRI